MPADLAIRGGRVVDGSGRPGRVADVAITSGVIQEIGPDLHGERELDVGLTADVRTDDRGAELIVRTRRFAQSIAVDLEGFAADDAYFHLPPGGERTLRLRRLAVDARGRGTLQPLNAEAVTKIVLA